MRSLGVSKPMCRKNIHALWTECNKWKKNKGEQGLLEFVLKVEFPVGGVVCLYV